MVSKFIITYPLEIQTLSNILHLKFNEKTNHNMNDVLTIV